jgi:hypothetical protein
VEVAEKVLVRLGEPQPGRLNWAKDGHCFH